MTELIGDDPPPHPVAAPRIQGEPSPTVRGPRSAGRTPSGTSSTRVTGRFHPGEIFARRYRIHSLLGIGGMGEVYEAHDEVLDVPVALKFITEISDERRERLLNEVRLARRVTHPNVCRVYDVGQIGQEYFITMEYVAGEDLAALLRQVGRFSADKLLDVAHQLCAGLAAAHAKGVLHQDLKPANILVDPEGQIRITDFGIATTLETTDRDKILGTPAYMAPERLMGQPPSVESDLYALGLVLYEMASGQPAFRATTPFEYMSLHRNVAPEALSGRISDLDPRLEAVILHCLEKDPRDRPKKALEVEAALPGGDPLKLAREAGDTPSPELVAKVRSDDEGFRFGAAAASVALLMLFLAGVLWTNARAVGLPGPDQLKPPEALADRAREILHELGHEEIGSGTLENEPPGRAWGFWPDMDSDGETVIRFWYRQSPFPLIPSHTWRLVYDSPRVDFEDPPNTEEGMVQMILDADGRLMMFYLIPAVLEEDQPAHREDGPDWEAAFLAGGFDPETIRPAEAARRVPRIYAEKRRSFTGVDPRAVPGDGEPPRVHIDTAVHRGRIVYWSAWPQEPEEVPEEEERSFFAIWAGTLYFDLGLILIVLLASCGARFNLRRGRGDLRGARNLVFFVVAAKAVYWILAASHVTILEAEILNFHVSLGVALVEALLVWLAYIALEPTVRRFWPQTLISWSRVLRGRWSDPLVGRSLLVGAVVGTMWAFLRAIDHLAVGWLDLPPLPEIHGVLQLELALDSRLPFAHLLTSALYAVYTGVLGLFLLATLRVVGRRAWVAVACFVVIQGTYEMLTAGHPEIAWFTLGVVIVGSAAWILVRFGLLTYIAALFVENVLTLAPITQDFSVWFSGAGLFALLVPVILAGFGLWHALAGRSLFGEWLVPEPMRP